jgi:hypothetical protein
VLARAHSHRARPHTLPAAMLLGESASVWRAMELAQARSPAISETEGGAWLS